MAVSQQDLITWAVELGITEVGGRVIFPDRAAVVALARKARDKSVEQPPTVADADVDTYYMEQAGQIVELRNNSPIPLVRGLCRALISQRQTILALQAQVAALQAQVTALGG